MILVEHDMQFVGALAERVVVLDRGRVIADGSPSEVRTDRHVIEAYLGSTTL
jgi:ABC-type branched-subunit amino acid transport system ATPase component